MRLATKLLWHCYVPILPIPFRHAMSLCTTSITEDERLCSRHRGDTIGLDQSVVLFAHVSTVTITLSSMTRSKLYSRPNISSLGIQTTASRKSSSTKHDKTRESADRAFLKHQETSRCGYRLSGHPLRILATKPCHDSGNVVCSSHPVLNGSRLQLTLDNILRHVV